MKRTFPFAACFSLAGCLDTPLSDSPAVGADSSSDKRGKHGTGGIGALGQSFGTSLGGIRGDKEPGGFAGFESRVFGDNAYGGVSEQ